MDKNEKLLRESIKRMVRESIFDYINGGMHEKKSEDSKDDSEETHKHHSKHEDNVDSRLSDRKKKRIIQALKDPSMDVAQFAYRLWPEKNEDSARSYFYKCLDGKTNDEGDVYSFTDDEYVRLESFLTDSVPEL